MNAETQAERSRRCEEAKSIDNTPPRHVVGSNCILDRDISAHRFKRGLLFLFILGLSIRVGYFIEHSHAPSFAVPTLDQKYYDTVAKMLLSGEDLRHLHGFKPLLYPLFLAGFYKLAGAIALPAVLCVQHLLGIGAGLIVALLAARIFGNRLCGLVSGAVFLLAPVPLAFEGELLVESSYTFLICLGLLLHFRAADRTERGQSSVFESPAEASADQTIRAPLKALWLWTLAGALTVLTAQARPNILVFLIVYPALAARFWLRSRQTASLSPLFGLVGALLMSVGWGFVNLKQSDAFHLLPGAGGVNLYLGNKRGAKGITAEQERRVTYSGAYQDPIEIWAREEYHVAMRAQGRQGSDDPMAISRYWTQRALKEIRAAPAPWCRLVIKKCWLMLWNVEIPNNKSFAFLREESQWLKWLPVRWIILLTLAPVGIWAAWRQGGRDLLFILLTFLIVYSAGNVAFFISDRYRYPVWPAMAVLAGGGLLAFRRLIQSRNMPAICWTAVSMIMMAGISLPNWGGVSLPTFARDYLFRSIAWYEKGNFTEALRDVNRSLELDSLDATALQQRGNVLYAMDQPAAAKASFERAMKLSPGEAVTWNNLGVVNERLGDTNAAIAAFRSATQCEPPSRNAFISLACLQIRTGQFSETEQTLASLEKVTAAPDASMLALQSVLARHAGDVPRAGALEGKARALDNAATAWVLERAGEPAESRVR